MKHVSLLAPVFLAACALPGARSGSTDDPSQGEVPLATVAADWRAFLVHDNDDAGRTGDGHVGIWAVMPVPLFGGFACPELVGLDDRGRCWILVSYSGKWTPLATVGEKTWLGTLAHGDVDPRIAGAELYVGGAAGHLHQVVPYADGRVDHRRIASFPGHELHTLLAGELDPRSDGPELLAFTRPGALHRIAPTGPDGTFVTERLAELPGRVRDAVVLPTGEIATVSRAGTLELLRVRADGVQRTVVYEAPMGLGRLALARSEPGSVLYATRDDGVVLRFARDAAGDWEREEIYLGPQGPRGLATGRFHADPDVESVAVFGYSGRVELLSRAPGAAWTVETLFEDRAGGHWLSVAEVDGRNATDELVGSGYGGRVFLLARPAGYGRGDVPSAER